jgi:hypothetical protein
MILVIKIAILSFHLKRHKKLFHCQRLQHPGGFKLFSNYETGLVVFMRRQLATVTGCIIVAGILPRLLGKTPAVTSVSALRRALLGQGMRQYRSPPSSYKFRVGP